MDEVLSGIQDRIWVGDLQDSEKEEGVRRRALSVFLHVSYEVRYDREGD